MSDKRPHTVALTASYQSTSFWSTLAAPGDYTSGTASTSWTPVVTVLNAVAPATAPIQTRREAYGQLVAMLRQTREQARTSTALAPSAKGDSMMYADLLIRAYEPFTAPNAITV